MSYFKQILDASKGNGFWHRVPGAFTIVVLTGEWTGTWRFAKFNGKWSPYMGPIVRRRPKTMALYNWQEKQLKERIPGYSHTGDTFLYVWEQLTGCKAPMEKGPWVGQEIVKAIHLAYQISRRPTRMKFLKNHSIFMSVDKALKATFPKVSRPWMDVWKEQHTKEEALHVVSGMDTYGLNEEARRRFLNEAAGYEKYFTRAQWRSLLMTKWVSYEGEGGVFNFLQRTKRFSELLDTVVVMGNMNTVAQNHGFPRTRMMLQAEQFKKEMKWHELRDLHDYLHEEWRGMRNSIGDAQQARTKKLREREFILPIGVTKLTTKEEFEKEGEEMHHCVAGYWGMHCNILAFRIGNDRATLELDGNNRPRQFRSFHNNTPTQEMKDLLKEFLNLNRPKEEEEEEPEPTPEQEMELF